MSELKNVHDSGDYFHSGPDDLVVSYGFVAEAAGWESVESVVDDAEGHGFVLRHGEICMTVLECDGQFRCEVYANGDLVADSNNPGEAVWMILDNGPGPVPNPFRLVKHVEPVGAPVAHLDSFRTW